MKPLVLLPLVALLLAACGGSGSSSASPDQTHVAIGPVDPAGVAFVRSGQSRSFSANTAVTWTVSDPSWVVDENGVVLAPIAATSLDQATLTATASGSSAHLTLETSPPLSIVAGILGDGMDPTKLYFLVNVTSPDLANLRPIPVYLKSHQVTCTNTRVLSVITDQAIEHGWVYQYLLEVPASGTCSVTFSYEAYDGSHDEMTVNQ